MLLTPLLGPAVLITWSLAILAQAPSSPHRIGPTAGRLTADDVAQITRLAEDAGGQPWVVVARQLPLDPPGRQMWLADVYFAPNESGSRVRRGRALTVTTQIPSRENFSGSRTWSRASNVEPFFGWAQVPEAGRDADEVTDSHDRNRPFPVRSQIADETLAGAIAAVRQSPGLPVPEGWPAGRPISEHALQVQGMWPVADVAAADDGILVHLRTGPNESGGQRVLARLRNGQWEVSLAGFFTHME